jgi:hypothetical protein
MKQVQSYLDSLNTLLKAGESFRSAYTNLVPVYNKMSIKEQVEVRNSVATLVGVRYGVAPRLMKQGSNKGCLGFDQHSSNRKERDAREALRYWLPVSKSEVKSTSVKKASKATPVDKLTSKVKAFVKSAKKSEIQQRIDLLAIELKLLKQFV